MKFGVIFLKLNTHRLTESNFWLDVTLSCSRSLRHITQKSAAIWWMHTKRLPGAHAAESGSSQSILHSYLLCYLLVYGWSWSRKNAIDDNHNRNNNINNNIMLKTADRKSDNRPELDGHSSSIRSRHILFRWRSYLRTGPDHQLRLLPTSILSMSLYGQLPVPIPYLSTAPI